MLTPKHELEFKIVFARSCLLQALLDLKNKSIDVTKAEQVFLESFITQAIYQQTYDYICKNKQVYESRLSILMQFAAKHLSFTTQSLEQVLESLSPWHPWS